MPNSCKNRTKVSTMDDRITRRFDRNGKLTRKGTTIPHLSETCPALQGNKLPVLQYLESCFVKHLNMYSSESRWPESSDTDVKSGPGEPQDSEVVKLTVLNQAYLQSKNQLSTCMSNWQAGCYQARQDVSLLLLHAVLLLLLTCTLQALCQLSKPMSKYFGIHFLG